MTERGSAREKKMSVRAVRLQHHLTKVYKPLIDMSDVKNPDPEEQRRKFLSRAIAAYAIECLASADPKIAAQAVTDDYGECGLDALYFDRGQQVLYLVQSKWSDNSKKGMDPGDFLKLAGGFERILNLELDDFNDKVKKKSREISDAVYGNTTMIVVVAAPTEKFATGMQKEVTRFLRQHNSGSSALVSVEKFDIDRLYQCLHSSATSSVALDITLREWGRIKDPYTAYYGQVELSDVIQWKKHGKSLFDKNLRNFIGTTTEVYDSVLSTLQKEPQHFWYFNNGITILCNSISKKTIHGDAREKGHFHCAGVSIVNGAQTIGSIWDLSDSDLDPGARVGVRLISLEKCPPTFSADVTRATNTQQKIERRDFLALDPNQHRIARDLALDGKRYVFRQGDDAQFNENVITATEATVALACSNGNVNLAAAAKREISTLWANIHQKPYTLLFNDRTSAEVLWRAVRILRAVEQSLAATKFNFSKGQLVNVHGDRFILYRVFKQDPIRSFRNSALDLEELAQKAALIAGNEVARVATDLSTNLQGSVTQNIFKNAKQCGEIDDRLDQQSAAEAGQVVERPGVQLSLDFQQEQK